MLINVEKALYFHGGDTAFLRESWSMFCDHLSASTKEVQKAVETEDTQRLRGLAHGLRSAAAAVGADDLCDLADGISKTIEKTNISEFGLKMIALMKATEGEICSLARGEPHCAFPKKGSISAS